MNNEHTNNAEGINDGDDNSTGVFGYEDLMEARKITFVDIKEHLTGPVISTIVHIVLLSFLGTIVVFEAPKEQKDITVEVKNIEPQEIEPPPPPPEPPEPVETDAVDDRPVMTPDVDVEVDVQVDDISVDAPTEVELPNVLNMKLSNSALKLAVPPAGRRTGHGGKIGGFGYGKRADGDLVGVLYDLKTDPTGKARQWDYWRDTEQYITDGFKIPQSNPFRQLKKKLFLSHLYIPRIPASEGPKQFGVESIMQPSGFFVHYSGSISPKAEFRFAGQADDLLVVAINGKIVFDGSWHHCMSSYTVPDPQQYPCFTQQPMVFGNWIKPGKYKMDILFGERPGGWICGVLLVQEKGKTYPTAAGGRPILPIFTTMGLNKEEEARIKSEPWAIATDGPVMNFAKQASVKKEKKVTGLEIR